MTLYEAAMGGGRELDVRITMIVPQKNIAFGMTVERGEKVYVPAFVKDKIGRGLCVGHNVCMYAHTHTYPHTQIHTNKHNHKHNCKHTLQVP
jgi:hypothetical protein